MDRMMGISFEEVKADLLKNPETAKAYEELRPEYELISQIIQTRIDKNMTQAELAKLAGTRQSNISRLESGNYNPSLIFLKKIAGSLGKRLHIILE